MNSNYSKFKADSLHSLLITLEQTNPINVAAAEKDFWICWVLDYIFSASPWNNALTFKGGTSLSKCYALINRFSEDIDLILDWRSLGYGIDEPWAKRSNTKQLAFNREVNEMTGRFLQEKFIPKLQADIEVLSPTPFSVWIDPNDPQTVLVDYPKLFDTGYLTPQIRLEVGPLAAWTPSRPVAVRSDLQVAFPQAFGDYVPMINTVLPERTFWEKLTILHQEAHRPADRPMRPRYARHYYDTYCLANSPYKESAFAQKQLLKRVVAFLHQFYPRGWAEYEKATTQEICLIPPLQRFDEIRKDYQAMREMFTGPSPSFDEMMDGIAHLEKEVHALEA